MKVIIGAANTSQDGWVSTNIGELNLLRPDTWVKYMPVDMALAEHIWEHLTLEEGREAARQCFKFVPRLRVATPDGFFPDAAYVERAILGECPGDHQALYNYKTLTNVFAEAGYNVELLEWWDEQSVFHYRPWSPEFGIISRSLCLDARNRVGKIGYTSIILDAIKQR